jgi:hypothetical protein
MVKYKKLPLGHVFYKLGRRRSLFLKSSKKVGSIKKRPKLTTVEIDRDQFLDGFDINVDCNYHNNYNKLRSVKDASDPIGKIKSFKEAKNVFNSWLKTNKGDKRKSGKQKPYIHPTLIKVVCCLHKFGECLLGASNKTKAGFKCRFLNKKGSDGYVHHVAILANSNCKKPIHELSSIKKVSQSKKGSNSYTISHLCGNGGCARPGHLLIESKKNNDERTMCHIFLRRCRSCYEAKLVRRLCPHKPKCFVNVYKDITNYY